MNPDELSTKLVRLDELELRFDAAVQHAKLEAMKELAYGAGHEINNPLANIATRAQTLLRDETNPDKRRKLAAINAQAFRAHEMIADLMLFARPPQMRPEATDLNALVQSIAQQWSSEAQDANVEIIVNSTSAPLTVTADPVQLRVALGALVRNSLDAIDGGGQIEICIRAIGGDGNGSAHALHAAEITVADNGPGIPPEIRDKIFDPFFSGREAGRGLGFGLSKCWRIVTLHGGEIKLRDTAHGGATFVIMLPFSSAGTRRARFLKAADDALHIAIAATKAIPFLLTWNCRHLANAVMRPVIETVCKAKGFKAPIICTPEELLGSKP